MRACAALFALFLVAAAVARLRRLAPASQVVGCAAPRRRWPPPPLPISTVSCMGARARPTGSRRAYVAREAQRRSRSASRPCRRFPATLLPGPAPGRRRGPTTLDSSGGPASRGGVRAGRPHQHLYRRCDRQKSSMPLIGSVSAPRTARPRSFVAPRDRGQAGANGLMCAKPHVAIECRGATRPFFHPGRGDRGPGLYPYVAQHDGRDCRGDRRRLQRRVAYRIRRGRSAARSRA